MSRAVSSRPIPVEPRGRFDVDLVERLARLQLAARRLGFTLWLTDVPTELGDLIDFVGLREVLFGAQLGELRRQAFGQAEGGEQAGVDEVVVPDDPVA